MSPATAKLGIVLVPVKRNFVGKRQPGAGIPEETPAAGTGTSETKNRTSSCDEEQYLPSRRHWRSEAVTRRAFGTATLHAAANG